MGEKGRVSVCNEKGKELVNGRKGEEEEEGNSVGGES